MVFFTMGIGCTVLLGIISSLFKKKSGSRAKECSLCGAESKYGYVRPAEGAKHVFPMCRRCLISRLEGDYTTFPGRAVVIQPVPGPPCYLFHSNREWANSFKESRMDDDARAHLLRMEKRCPECGQEAKYLWIESSGLTEHNFGKVLAKGFSETLLPRNPKPISLCGVCCVRRIGKALAEREISYIEVSSPDGTEDGFVIPMAY